MTSPLPGDRQTQGGAAAAVSAGWTRALRRTAELSDDQTMLLADVVDAHAARDGMAPALLDEQSPLTYAALAARINRYARWGLAQGLRPGDTVALLLRNEPDYVAIWLGLSRIGVVTALINTQTTGVSLAHGLMLANPKAAIVGHAFVDVFREAVPADGAAPVLWVHGGEAGSANRIDAVIDDFDGSTLGATERPHIVLRDRALLIFTSGTTGLPKAANVSHYRILMWSQWFAGLMDARPEDRLYDCLPLYHSVGGIVAVGAMLAAGGSVVIRERFSATRFWDDVTESGCTIFQYIGELCRYLVNQPARGHERDHTLRLCCGNGLRGDVWPAFQARFAIPRILEFYAATEGSFSLFNMEGKAGAIGKIPGFMAHRSPVALVRFDWAAGQPRRGADGFCIRCGIDEAGEAIGRLALKSAAIDTNAAAAGLSTRFEGYTNQAETEKKILRDVFVPGDAWFRTGDLMRKDAKGFYYFIDRLGDTFRWKGENVATSEVEAILHGCSGVIEASVYGVEVRHHDGRAGMAALVVEEGFDLTRLHDTLVRCLPSFARPVFLRLRASLDVTSTFKQKKQALIEEGFDPTIVLDPLYILDPIGGGFERLDSAHYVSMDREVLRL